MKYLGIMILSLIALAAFCAITWALGIAAGIIKLPAHDITNKVQLNHDVIDETVNAKNCLTWQDWFKTSEANITTLQQTITTAQEAVDQFKADNQKPYSDTQQQELSTLEANLTGAKNEANDAVNTYNAKAKEENLAYCKNGLPLFIHPF